MKKIPLGDGVYTVEPETESFDHFCADFHVLCADGEELLYGYRN